MPRFSVVVPAYQAQSTLGETLDAILGQTFGDWECIVVDDGSTDDTLAIASAYADARSSDPAIHQDNQGTAGAYNTGVSGRPVISSSSVRPMTSCCRITWPACPRSSMRSTDTTSTRPTATSGGPMTHGSWSTAAASDVAVRSLGLADVIHRCFFSVGATYRRDLFATVGGYRLGVYSEDYDFWLRAMASGARHRYLPEPLALHRVSATQKSARLETVYRSDIRLISDLKQQFPLSPEDRLAADEAIRERQAMIDEFNRPWGLYRDLIRPAIKRSTFALLGQDRARRLANALRSAAGRPSHL